MIAAYACAHIYIQIYTHSQEAGERSGEEESEKSRGLSEGEERDVGQGFGGGSFKVQGDVQPQGAMWFGDGSAPRCRDVLGVCSSPGKCVGPGLCSFQRTT